MPVKIRGIQPSDRSLIIRVTDETRAFLPEELTVVGEIIDEYFHDPEGSGYYFLIAEHDGDFAGYLCYGPTPLTHGAWDMYWCAVSPKLHGQGIASTLIHHGRRPYQEPGRTPDTDRNLLQPQL